MDRSHIYSHHFQIPRLERYNGSIDPNEHVDHYWTIMTPTCISNYNVDDVMCKVFHISLKRLALTWFNRLKLGTIIFSSEMILFFELHFVSSWKIEADANDLLTVNQSQNEPLRSYVQRFMKVPVEIFECDDSLVVVAFQKGLHVDSELYSSLTRQMSCSMAEAL